MCEMVSHTFVQLLEAYALFINRITLLSSSQMTGLQRSRQSSGNKRLCFVLFLEQCKVVIKVLFVTQFKTDFSDCPKKSETAFSLNDPLC